MTIVEEDLNDQGKEFISYAEEYKVDLNCFFKMFSFWLGLTGAQKQAVIVECIKTGKVDLSEGKIEDGKQGGESK